MTVKELKNALENMPEEYKVFIFCEVDSDFTTILSTIGGEAYVVERNDLTSNGFVAIWGQ